MDRSSLVQLVSEKVLHEIRLVKGWIPIEVSVRHLHLCKEDMEKLFGQGYKLEKLRDLTQPGEFAAKETVTVVGPRFQAISRVRVLGPLRPQTQVELSQTDGVVLGLDLPVRRSGNLKGSAKVTLVGPCGVLHMEEGAIRANRHIHMDPLTAKMLNLNDNDRVRVRAKGEKPTVFGAFQVRIGENLVPVVHVDTDDANAAGISSGDLVEIVNDD